MSFPPPSLGRPGQGYKPGRFTEAGTQRLENQKGRRAF